jgi:hypothetical protein
MSRQQFWTYNLNIPTRRYYSNYSYPRVWYEDLRRISKYCRDNDINFKIIILPTHIQLQAKIQEYGLTKEYKVYLEDLAEVAAVYDFNKKNHWTEDKNNFEDPRHFKRNLARKLIREIWHVK